MVSDHPGGEAGVTTDRWTEARPTGAGTAARQAIEGVTIGRARSADLPRMLDLLEAASLPTGGVDACLPWAVVARLDGRVVGVAALEPHGRSALLRSVAVDPHLRGSRLGTRLVGQAVGGAREIGAAELYLLTETAEPFFARLGWARVAWEQIPDAVRQSVEFTDLCPVTAVAMWLSLEDEAAR